MCLGGTVITNCPDLSSRLFQFRRASEGGQFLIPLEPGGPEILGFQANPNRLARDLGMQVVNPAPMLHQVLSSLRPTGFLRFHSPAIVFGKSVASDLVVTVGKQSAEIGQFGLSQVLENQ